MKTVHVQVQPHSNASARLLAPTGFCDGVHNCQEFSTKGQQTLVPGDFGKQSAWLIEPADSQSVMTLSYRFGLADDELPETFFERQNNRYSRASEGLRAELQNLPASNQKSGDMSTAETVAWLMEKARALFDYGHVDKRFNDDCEAVPAVCGTTRGSCVDMNTYLMASALSLGIPVQYVAGYWFHPSRQHTHDMHCWLVFQIDGEPQPWDLAHHLKWGVPTLGPGLNPAGGRRVPMTFGRGLTFHTDYGPVQISHFSEPVWITPDGQSHNSEIHITIED